MKKFLLAGLALALVSTFVLARARAPERVRINPMIDLLEQQQPVFGVYAPRSGRGAEEARSPAELAREALAYEQTDFIFDGTMEGNFERGYPAFEAFVRGMAEAGVLRTDPAPRLSHPLVVKMHEIAPDPALAAANIARQLDLGVSTVVFVGVESAEELRTGVAAMRYAARGGTRPDRVGGAPAYWGITEEEYRARADVWPLNPQGELVAWAIVESHEGLANLREIAAVPGVAVLFPGAGTLRGVFTSTDENGERALDAEGWEGAIQEVLAACKEFDRACGYPANASDIEMRMAEGFSVFIMGWGEAGFEAVGIGRAAAGRTD